MADIRRTYVRHTANIRQIYDQRLKSRSPYKRQLRYPYINNPRISFWPYMSRISGVCQPYIYHMSGVCPSYIVCLSAVCQPSVSRITAVCRSFISRMSAGKSRMSAVCPQYMSRTSAIQPYLIFRFAIFCLSLRETFLWLSHFW